jgi:hypothetical protein
MRCPYYADDESTGTTAQCFGVIVPFEPSPIDQTYYCTTSYHRHCALYRNACSDLSLRINREVERAVG